MRSTRLLWGFCCWLGLAQASQAQENKVVEIAVDKRGLRKVSESLILSTIGIKPGIELSQENIQEAIRALNGLNVFADVQLWGDPVPGGIKLIAVVEEFPSLEEVRFKGHKNLKEKEMKDALGLVAGQVVAPKDIARGRQKILDLYAEKGYLRAEIEGKLFDAEAPGKVFLQYDIKEGEKVKIAQIRILNAGAFAESKIEKQMKTKEKRWWRKGEFKADTLAMDKDKILAFYRSKGYQQAAIVRDSIYYDESRRNLFIDLELEEGIQYRMGEVKWEGNRLFTEEQLREKLPLKKGETYKYGGQELAYLVKSTYYEKGYLDTEVIPEEVPRGDSVDVRFAIFEGHPFRIGQVNIIGNTKTRETVLRRELELRPGDVYQQSLVQESQRRLYMLNFFKDVQIQTAESQLDTAKAIDLTFQVEERPTGTASMGAGYSDRDKLVGTIGLQIPNLRGAGQNLDFSWEFGTRREQFLVGFTEPWLFDTPTSFSLRVYTLNQQYYNSFDRKSNSANVRIGRRLRWPAFSTLSIGYQLRDDRYSDFQAGYESLQNDPRYQARTTSSFELYYQRDTRDFPQFPSKGTVLSYRPEVASSFIAGDVDFHRHELIFNYYRPSFWHFVWSLETKVAAVQGFSGWDNRNLPFFDRFTPGGVDWWDGQVRGYPDASLGPRINNINMGGRAMMVLNLEYRFPLVNQQFYGLIFADAGNSWDKATQLNPTNLRRSTGVGFRVMVPMMGMIGFDFGYGFDRRKVDGERPGWITHFQFGPRFF